MKLIVISPACTSDSAIQLAEQLSIPFVCKDSDAFNHFNLKSDEMIVNWGCSKLPGGIGDFFLNKPGAVRRSLNKLTTFRLLSDKIRMPVMTQDKAEAVEWAKSGRKVVVRNRIKGCKGQGITMSTNPQEVETLPAKFYTRFIAGCTEYRVNCYKGKILSVYYKQPSNGDFRFKIQLDFESNADIQGMVEATHEHLKLDMYGLDILKSPKGKYFLLEVNSAPILFPITIKRLAKEIKKDYENV